jgi:hypothetical protein
MKNFGWILDSMKKTVFSIPVTKVVKDPDGVMKATRIKKGQNFVRFSSDQKSRTISNSRMRKHI